MWKHSQKMSSVGMARIRRWSAHCLMIGGKFSVSFMEWMCNVKETEFKNPIESFSDAWCHLRNFYFLQGSIAKTLHGHLLCRQPRQRLNFLGAFTMSHQQYLWSFSSICSLKRLPLRFFFMENHHKWKRLDEKLVNVIVQGKTLKFPHKEEIYHR